jgi:hypothetical protein
LRLNWSFHENEENMRRGFAVAALVAGFITTLALPADAQYGGGYAPQAGGQAGYFAQSFGYQTDDTGPRYGWRGSAAGARAGSRESIRSRDVIRSDDVVRKRAR